MHDSPAPASQSSSLSQVSSHDSSGAPSLKRPRTETGELRSYHAPWDTPPNHCLDLANGRSRIDEYSFEMVWDYMSRPTKFLKYRTEFAGDAARQGVALSRVAQICRMVCIRVLDKSNPVRQYCQPVKLKQVSDEAERLLPHFKMLTATEAQKRWHRTCLDRL